MSVDRRRGLFCVCKAIQFPETWPQGVPTSSLHSAVITVVQRSGQAA